MKRDPLALKIPKSVTGRVEIARSFSFKLNLGGYQSADFFCSQKAECDAADAEETSEALYRFCKSSVLKSVREFEQQQAEAEAARKVVEEKQQRMRRTT